MHHNFQTLIIIILSLLTISCATQRQKKRQTSDFIEIKFGSSGGFTGFEVQYLLKNNGEVYKVACDSIILINQITESEINNISLLIKCISFKDIVFSEIGNMTYFIEVSTIYYKKRVSWIDQSQAIELKNFYKELVETLKD